MGRIMTRMLVLVLGAMLLASRWGAAQAQPAQPYRIYLPAIPQTTFSLAGDWAGYLVQPGKAFGFSLSLAQEGDQVTGTSTAVDGIYTATWSLTGTVRGETLTLTEQEILASFPRPGTTWCVKELTLRPELFASGVAALSGSWSDPGCNAGTLFLQPAAGPFLPVAGVWSGVITQGETDYALTLELAQDGAMVEGLAEIRRDAEVGVLSLTAYVGGLTMRIEEQEVLATSGTSWCIKSMDATYTLVAGAPTLQGTWEAPGCIPGTFTLTRQSAP